MQNSHYKSRWRKTSYRGPKGLLLIFEGEFEVQDKIPQLVDNDHPTKNDMKATTLLNKYLASVLTKEGPIIFEINCQTTVESHIVK